MDETALAGTTAPVGFSETECGCGCQNLLPLTVYNRGWRYLRGHKGYLDGEGAGARAARMALKREKPAPVEHTSYARTLEMARANLAAALEKIHVLTYRYAEALQASEGIWASKDAADVEAAKLSCLVDALAAVCPEEIRTAKVEHCAAATEDCLVFGGVIDMKGELA
jgi:hypothetical protein